MITALILSATLMAAPTSDPELRDLEQLNAHMQSCISDVRAKTISRARASCRAALDFSLKTPYSDAETRNTISSMVWTLNTHDLAGQGWRP